MSQLKLTRAQRRALEAVRNGDITHVYHRDGNAYRCPPGVGPSAVRALETYGLIRDADSYRGWGVVSNVVLTDPGRKILWHEDTR